MPERPTEAEVRFSVYLDPEQFKALERLQALCGHSTIEETIEKAIQLYIGEHKEHPHA